MYFRRLADIDGGVGTRRALTIGMAVLATGGLLAVGLWALPWVRDESGSLAADFAILSAWTVLALGAAWFQVAAFVPGGRAAVEEAVRGGDAASSPAVAPRVLGLHAKGVLRSLLIAFAVLGNLVWSDLVAGEFWFGHYARSGVQATALRSRDPETRRWAIARIAEAADPALEDQVERLARLLRDEDPGVRADAVAALGHLAWRMRMAVKVLQREGMDRGRFEVRVLRAAEQALGDPARGILATRGLERRAWTYAAGAVGDASVLPVLERLCGSEDPADVVAAVGALADIASPRSLPVLADLMANRSAEPGVHAAWATGLVMASVVGKDPAGASRMPEVAVARDLVRERLAGLEPEGVCAFLRWFPEVSDASMTGALVNLARSRTFLLRCRRMERARWFGAPEVVVPEAPVSAAVLRAMASVAVGNEELKRFLDEAVGSPGFPDEVRVRWKELRDAASRTR